MFPSFAPTSVPLSLDQIGNPNPSSFSYPISNNSDQTYEYDFDDILDNYKFLIDPPSYQDSIHSDFLAHVSSSEHNPIFQEMTTTDTIPNKDYSCLDSAALFSSENNPVLQEITTTDAITYKDYMSCLDFADYFSIDEQNTVMEQTTTTGSSSKTSHNSINDSFLPQPNDFHIDKVMRERHTGLKIALRMKTTLEVVDDGYKWRKYGKKKIKINPYPRNYFKCSTVGCIVKKRIERDKDDSRYVITTYEGVHNHKVRKSPEPPRRKPPLNFTSPPLNQNLETLDSSLPFIQILQPLKQPTPTATTPTTDAPTVAATPTTDAPIAAVAPTTDAPIAVAAPPPTHQPPRNFRNRSTTAKLQSTTHL